MVHKNRERLIRRIHHEIEALTWMLETFIDEPWDDEVAAGAMEFLRHIRKQFNEVCPSKQAK